MRPFVATLIVVLTGCAATVPTVDPSGKSLVELTLLMEQAAGIEKTGTKEAAIRKYEEAAKLYPASKLPWLRVAQIQFDSSNYGEAIVAAHEVVARDERDKVANSILSVSGLRVATKALSDLSRQNELSGTVRNEARDLAKVLRENLGEKVLVPAQVTRDTSKDARPTVRSSSTSAKSSAGATMAPAAAPAAAPATASPATSSGGGSPFSNLK